MATVHGIVHDHDPEGLVARDTADGWHSSPGTPEEVEAQVLAHLEEVDKAESEALAAAGVEMPPPDVNLAEQDAPADAQDEEPKKKAGK